MTTAGIDGCAAGWCAALFNNYKISVEIFSSFQELIDEFENVELMLIDIPIGLGSRAIPRDIDFAARKMLDPTWSSSIFIPPVREAIAASGYEEAKKINRQVTGKMISIQSWHISRKIIEVDKVLMKNPAAKKKLFESHPEICFKMLNRGKSLTYKKAAPGKKGIEERLGVLSKFHPGIYKDYSQACKKIKGRNVKDNDVVDAMCLAIAAQRGLKSGFEMIEGSNKKDAQGIEMMMYFYNPEKF